MEIKTEKYSVTYDSTTATVTCEGSLLLNGSEEYEPILQLLKTSAEQQEYLTLDLRTLKFLNSSGINMMTKFVVYVSDIEKLDVNLTVVGYKNVAWQEKLSKNLKRLMPTLQTRLE
jgi:hypothetical protein